MKCWVFLFLSFASTTRSQTVVPPDEWNPACDGKQVMIEMFEWRWDDLALECERFLSEAGYCGIQTSPVAENILITSDYNRPWWERYQPISYNLVTRSGDRDDFIDMVHRCNTVGVRIFADVLLNHMGAVRPDTTGVGGSTCSPKDFPAVPYVEEDFTPRELCPSGSGGVDDYSDPDNVRYCDLAGLQDLYGATDYVRQREAEFLNDLIEIGVAGFRVDAAKHMWPEDLEAIIALVNDLNTDQGFPANTRPSFFFEVIDRNDGAVRVQEYSHMGRVTEFRYSQKITWGIDNFYELEGVYDPGWFMADPWYAFTFIDNHDNQRGHGGAGDVLTHKAPKDYRLGAAFTFAQPYGFNRIMSSYEFGTDTNIGPPFNPEDMSIKHVTIGDDNMCDSNWICEHRWPSIYKMTRFANAVQGTDWENYYTDGNSVCAFSRGDLGFFAMVKYGTLEQTFQTGMPAGTYEELLSCSSVTVNGDGTATVSITNEDEPVWAICQGCDCTDVPTRPTDPALTTPPLVTESDSTTEAVQTDSSGVPTTTDDSGTTSELTTDGVTPGMTRTVIFLETQTMPGQDAFLRGGIDENIRTGCTEDAETDACAISINVVSLGTDEHYDGYNGWRVGDTKLDWYGAQTGQGSYDDIPASGTPLAWTTNNQSHPGYQPLNAYGDHFWMADLEMDCSEAEDGWFEMKGFVTNSGSGWESDISQDATCNGTAGGATPYITTNHMGRCGYLNVFTFGSDSCVIDIL